MRKFLFFTLIGWLSSVTLHAQVQVAPPLKRDFIPSMGFLASDYMKGREVGSRESFMAADYIVSQMLQTGLLPGSGNAYFQDFAIIRSKVQAGSLTLISHGQGKADVHTFQAGSDFVAEGAITDISVFAPLVYAGYGLVAPYAGVNDYAALNAKGSVVVVYDGCRTTGNSTGVSAFATGKILDEADYTTEAKKRNAIARGAAALILICSDSAFAVHQAGHSYANPSYTAFGAGTAEIPAYTDADWYLTGDQGGITLFYVNQRLGKALLDAEGLKIELKKSSQPHPDSRNRGKLGNCEVQISLSTSTETLTGRNVLGLIRGADTTRCVVIGAHYDHLGERNGLIYSGSDDNASGVAGMLALAAAWKRSGVQPPVNLLFAAWAGEEKGHLGSRYFVNNHDFNKTGILLNLNFDMISRSDEADTARNILSIGMLQGSNDLRQMAMMENSRLNRPFNLDLWETKGGGGSDYAAFSLRKIPVMSFFTGFHKDYHSPGDTFAKADHDKMEAVLQLANRLLVAYLSLNIR